MNGCRNEKHTSQFLNENNSNEERKAENFQATWFGAIKPILGIQLSCVLGNAYIPKTHSFEFCFTE